MTNSQDMEKEIQVAKKIKQNQEEPSPQPDLDIGPNILDKPQNIIQEQMPQSRYYEKSLMHRDIVTHISISKINDFVITASNDGHLKFWKKAYRTIEFVKHFRAHVGMISSMSLSPNHDYLATVSPADKQLKVFDVLNFDLSTITNLDFQPSICCYFMDPQTKIQRVAVSEGNKIHILDLFKSKQTQEKVLKLHSQKVKFIMVNSFIQFNIKYNIVVSVDELGIIEYWSPATYDFPKNLKFRLKLETDLYDMAKAQPLAFNFSNQFDKFAIQGSDHQIRIFDFLTGKIVQRIACQPELSDELLMTYNIDKLEYDRRQQIEKDIRKQQDNIVLQSLQFDDSDSILVFCNFLGIHQYDLEQNKIILSHGTRETSDRYLQAILYQGKALKNPSNNALESTKKSIDPLFLCTSYKKQRFYIFSNREPEDQSAIARDIFNEKPTKDDQQNYLNLQNAKKLPTLIMIQTTLGDITIKLFPEDCPKTVENFTTHAQNGYYDNLIFHRVIKNFMIQTGDPKGDGTGGESIWGGEFEDEIKGHLKHDRAFTLSMANAGPNTNGSQFFITTIPCSWLDGKHTVFGRVTTGMDVVQDIEKQKCDDLDKPLRDIKIKTILIIQ